MFKDPLLLAAISFAAGVLIHPAVQIAAWQAGIVFGAFTVAAAISRYTRLYVQGMCLAAGMLTAYWQSPGFPPRLDAADGEAVILTGCVTEPPSFSEEKEQFVLDLEPQARVRVTRFLRDGEAPQEIRYGQTIEIQAKVRKPHNFGNPGSFDYAGYLARRHIYWTASMSTGTNATVLAGECGSAAMRWMYQLRTWLLRRIELLYEGEPFHIAMLQALLIGESARFERVWADQFRRTGTYHAIVISGLHVTVIAGFALALLRLLPFDRNALRLIAVAMVWIYAGMCAWQAPVVRAAGGFTLHAIGCFYYRRSRVLNLLAALTFVFLALDTAQLDEASFQLTFLSVLVLGALAAPAVEATTGPLRYGLRDLHDVDKDMHVEPGVAQFRVEMRLIAETLSFWLRLKPATCIWMVRIILVPAFLLWEMMLVSAVIQLGLALSMVLYFHRLSISGLTANVIVTPLLTVAVPVALVALSTGWGWLLKLTAAMIGYSLRVAEWHASWEPHWRIPDPPLWLATLFLISLTALAVFRRRVLLVPALALLAVIIWHPFEPAGTQGRLELTMIDVGQGDSLLIGFPDGKWMLVDGGGIPAFGKRPRARMDIGEDVVAPYLFTRGIRRIDVIASSHQHEDHAGGLAALIDSFRPRELWAGATPESTLWKTLRQRVPTVRNLRKGDAFQYGGVKVDVLAPSPDYQPKGTPSNNDSLVLRLRYGEHSFLLTGDAERAAEYGFLSELSKTQVLKVAHHGSKTSTHDALLDAAKPVYALISAGRDNIFRHPHPDVLRRLKEHHATVFRSDEWGLVTIRSDGRRLEVETNRWRD